MSGSIEGRLRQYYQMIKEDAVKIGHSFDADLDEMAKRLDEFAKNPSQQTAQMEQQFRGDLTRLASRVKDALDEKKLKEGAAKVASKAASTAAKVTRKTQEKVKDLLSSK
jgi:hypothetical protein